MSSKAQKISKKVRLFSKRIAWKNILTFLFFLSLAIIFWFMLIYRQSYEVRVSMPIKYTEIPQNIVLKKELPTKISLSLRDDGASLFRYYFTKRNDSIEINFEKSFKKKVLDDSQLEELIRSKLFRNTTILGFYPSQISLEYDTLKRKKVPVIFDGQVYLAPGYMLRENIRVIPDSVEVFASSEILKKTSYVYTIPDTIENYNSTVPLNFNLIEIQGARIKPNQVLVEIPIEEFTQKELQIPITCLNVSDDLDLKIFPSFAKVSFFVSLSQYKSITEKDFEVQLDFNVLKNLTGSLAPIRLISTPDHIRNIKMEPANVEFILEQK